LVNEKRGAGVLERLSDWTGMFGDLSVGSYDTPAANACSRFGDGLLIDPGA